MPACPQHPNALSSLQGHTDRSHCATQPALHLHLHLHFACTCTCTCTCTCSPPALPGCASALHPARVCRPTADHHILPARVLALPKFVIGRDHHQTRRPFCIPLVALPAPYPNNAAKIHPLREQGAAGAPAPPPGESGAPRLNAVTTYHYQQQSTRPPPSPVCQPSPSTIEASPQQTPGPTRVRASVACSRCRSSKTKCDNEGEHTVCKACKSKGTACVYQSASGSSTGGASRRESTADGEQRPTKRQRKVAAHTPHVPIYSAPPPSSSVDGLGSYEDALESPLLTEEVWAELYAIYETHLAIDFPFFHRRLFLSCIRDRRPITESTPAMPQPHYPPLLLAFLTQTARFCPKLTAHMNDDPIATANFYAEATRKEMGKCDFPGEPTLEKVQALLMLGYHEWTALQGRKGWVRIGTAIRCAQCLEYQFDADQDDRSPAAIKEPESKLSEKDRFILRETQRRTFWSCFLLESYLSWGRNRPSTLSRDQFHRIQLPCSDGAFNFGFKARTRLLGETDEAYAIRRRYLGGLANSRHEREPRTDQPARKEDIRWEIGESESELTWYIKVVDLFGEIVKWSGNGGRRQKGTPAPWTKESTFKKLEDQLKALKSELPNHLQLNPEIAEDRIYNGSDKYVLIHALYTVCTVFLYREYMAMAPWSIECPQGPLDEPLITAEPDDPNYWVDQAKECWKTCKEFIDLLHSIQTRRTPNSLIQMPTVAFAAFTVALCTIYCHYFPHMDPDQTLSSRTQPRAHDVAHDYLLAILKHFAMAKSWIMYLAAWQRFYRDTRVKYKSVGGDAGDSPLSSASDGGGLKDYVEHFEQNHKQYGSMEPNRDPWTERDQDIKDARTLHDDDYAELKTSPNAAPFKRENGEARIITPVQISTGFTSVNSRPVTSPQSSDTNDQHKHANVPRPRLSVDQQFVQPVPNYSRAPPEYQHQPYYQPNLSEVPNNPHAYSGPSVPVPMHPSAGYDPRSKAAVEAEGRIGLGAGQNLGILLNGDATYDMGIPNWYMPTMPQPFYDIGSHWNQNYPGSGTGTNDYSYSQPHQ
ncbi:hypothetical protein NX059_006913 [Plenodomus lindquistii]|nr:hypothetical protein NX059_006913 [Plenodomus lindquistii]